MHYEMKFAVSKTEVHYTGLIQSMYKFFLKSSGFAFGIWNFSITTFRREGGFLSDKYCILFL